MKKAVIILSALFIIFSLIDAIHAQGKKKLQEPKSNVIANEIIKSVNDGGLCTVYVELKSPGRVDYPAQQFNPRDYFIAKSVAITKVGATVRTRKKNIFTGNLEEKYSAPILTTVKGSCTAVHNNGKELTVNGENKIELDQWNEWHLFGRSLNWAPVEVCKIIYDTCIPIEKKQWEKRQAEINEEAKRADEKRIAKEAEEERLKKMKQEEELAASKRFVENNDGTITDTVAGLIWAAHSAKGNVTWEEAESFCVRYRGGGYKDWRMPTLHELSERNDIKYRYSLNLQGTYWSSETRGSEAACFAFYGGNEKWFGKNQAYCKATPVRSTDNSSGDKGNRAE